MNPALRVRELLARFAEWRLRKIWDLDNQELKQGSPEPARDTAVSDGADRRSDELPGPY